MKDIQPFELDDGTLIYVEVPDADRGGMQRVGRSAEEDAKVAKRFTEALAHVKPAAETVLNAFKEMNTPNEIALEFGVKFSGKVGVMIASVDSEATFKVSLKWTNPQKPAVEPTPKETQGPLLADKTPTGE